jgi:hypothetical protein
MKRIVFAFTVLMTYVNTCQSATFTSAAAGPSVWNNPASWTQVGVDSDGIPDSNDDCIILSGHTIRLTGTIFPVNNLTINSGGELTITSNYNILKIFGTLDNEGDLTGRIRIFSGSGDLATIAGSGSYDREIRYIAIDGDLTFDATASIRPLYPGYMVIYANRTILNNGTVRFDATSYVNFLSSTSTFINGATGRLRIRNETWLNGSGTLDASAIGNTVEFQYPANNVLDLAGGYYNLALVETASANYQINADIVVAGNLITATSRPVSFNGNDLILGGNWTLNNNVSSLGTVTCNGSAVQTIGGTSSILPGAITINAGSTVQLSSALRINGNVQIDGNLDASASNFSIDLRGTTFTNNGTVIPNQGTIAFRGSVAQIISGTAVSDMYDLTLNNSNGLTISAGGVLLQNNLTTTSGTLTANGLLTLESTATRDARISANASVSGNVVVRRFIGAGTADYRDMCSPVVGATVADWDDDLIISGPSFPDGCAYGSQGCFTSVSTWNAVTQAYAIVTGPTQALTNGQGFEIFLGDDLNTFSGDVVSVTGTNPSGTRSISCRTNWNLIGNPMPSAIDFDLCTRNGSIQNYFYIYDPTTEAWEFYDGGTGTSSGSVNAAGLLSSAQGFWVFNSGATANFDVLQTAKSATTPTFVRAPQPYLAGTFNLVLSSNMNSKSCRSIVSMNAPTREMAESDILLFKGPQHPDRPNTAPVLAFVSENGEFVRKDNRITEESLSIPVMVSISMDGEYTITPEMLESLTEYSCVLLYDSKTGTYHNLRDGAYTFSAVGNGKDEVRFRLILTNDGSCMDAGSVVAAKENFISIRTFQNTVTVMVDNHPDMTEGTLTVYNMVGQMVVSPVNIAAEPATYEVFLPENEHGVYMVVVDFGDERITKKVAY